MVIVFFLLFSLSAFAQQVEFKTTCEDQYCVITAYNADKKYVGYLNLNGCYINYVTVFDEWRKKGFAQALLQQARIEAKNQNCSELALMPLTKLISYYEHNGFTCDEHRCTHPI